MKEKLIKIKDWIFIGFAVILISYFAFGEDIETKIILGSSFFILYGIFSIKQTGILQIILGIFVLIIWHLGKNHPLWLLNIVYFWGLSILFIFLYFHRRIRLENLSNRLKKAYHFFSMVLYGYTTLIVILMLKSTVGFEFDEKLPLLLTDYVFIIQVSLISVINFFLFFDNAIRIMPSKFIANLIGNYSAAHAVFCSLCITLLIGGYFYINGGSNQVLDKILIVLGTAFFTSLIIAEVIKSLFKK